ncbi:MAG: DUF4368 domain-containing protein [Oscillospiraceae bacterium]|nr:DUF4368 domain-containing protein [Oscillospiraceae bacterium]
MRRFSVNRRNQQKNRPPGRGACANRFSRPTGPIPRKKARRRGARKAHRDRLRPIAESAGEREQFIKAIRKFMEMHALTNRILRELIDHIDVYEVEGRGKNRPPGGW